MLKVLVFIFMTVSFMLIFGKLIQFAQTTIMIVKRFFRNRKAVNIEKKEVSKKDRLKKQFEAKGWRIAK